jgi:bifunctional non-homologous end joining protein LigD
MSAAHFVVHKHAAKSLHYDFRLEIDGKLKSWAVPRGPSMVASVKRLAVMVEDHELDYRDFEGVIPEGEYGAGAVMIWDEGSTAWEAGRKPGEMLDAGLLEFELSGKKLKGGFKLVHARMGGDEKNWLLVKRRDGNARKEDDVLSREPDSARTGRSMEQILAGVSPA